MAKTPKSIIGIMWLVVSGIQALTGLVKVVKDEPSKDEAKEPKKEDEQPKEDE